MTRGGGGLAEQTKGNGLTVPDSKVVAIDRARKRGPSDEGDGPELPVIRIEAGQLPRMVREGIAAIAMHPDIYQRMGQLVTIVREPERLDMSERAIRKGRDITLRPGTPKIEKVSLSALRSHLSEVAEWQKFVASKRKDAAGEGEWVPANADSSATAAILDPTSIGGWPDVRPIRGILESPSLAPSGSIILKPGYDAETGLLHLPSVDVGKIEDKPTRAQARAALKYLWTELFCDFPYLGLGESDPTDVERKKRYEQACKMPDAFVGVAALLAMFARPAIKGPILGSVFEAAAQGSGKSLQIDVISTVATGRGASLGTFPTHDGKVDEGELEKILASHAIAGSRLVVFDNVEGTLGGQSLAKAMTATNSISLRVLGASDQRTLPWTASIMFSGNNMAMNRDVADRVLCARLESEADKPRDRPVKNFRHPRLLSWIEANRDMLVRACLVILRAFIVAEDKSDAGTWGSFEAYSELIPAAILYAGGPNVLDLLKKRATMADSEDEAHGALIKWWPTTSYPHGVKAVELLRYANFQQEKEIESGKEPPDSLDELRGALRELTQTRDGYMPSTSSLGCALRGLRGKWRSGSKIDSEKDRTGVMVWRVVKRDDKTPLSAVSDSKDGEIDPAEDFER